MSKKPSRKPDPDDPFETGEWKAYARHVVEELVPMVTDSAVAVSVIGGGDNSKITPEGALQLGYMVLLDKPIIAVQDPDVALSKKMQAIADEVVVGRFDDYDFPRKLREAMVRLYERFPDGRV